MPRPSVVRGEADWPNARLTRPERLARATRNSRRYLLIALVADLPQHPQHPQHRHHRHDHHSGCNWRPECDRWADRRWSELHIRRREATGEYVASWFDDSEPVACGAHYTYGFASRTLPCGLRVTFRHGGQVVVGVVEDRGPFIGGRTFDLNPALRAALRCDDLCAVAASAS